MVGVVHRDADQLVTPGPAFPSRGLLQQRRRKILDGLEQEPVLVGKERPIRGPRGLARPARAWPASWPGSAERVPPWCPASGGGRRTSSRRSGGPAPRWCGGRDADATAPWRPGRRGRLRPVSVPRARPGHGQDASCGRSAGAWGPSGVRVLGRQGVETRNPRKYHTRDRLHGFSRPPPRNASRSKGSEILSSGPPWAVRGHSAEGRSQVSSRPMPSGSER